MCWTSFAPHRSRARIAVSVNRVEGETGVDPTEQAPCTRREYAFDKNGNRISAKTKAHAGGDCFYFGGQSTINYTYDALDRPVNAGDGNTALTLANPAWRQRHHHFDPGKPTRNSGRDLDLGVGRLHRIRHQQNRTFDRCWLRLARQTRTLHRTRDRWPHVDGRAPRQPRPGRLHHHRPSSRRQHHRLCLPPRPRRLNGPRRAYVVKEDMEKGVEFSGWNYRGLSAGLGVVPSFICSACAAGSAALGAASAGTYVAAGNKAAGKRTLISTGTNLVLGGAKIRNVARPLARGRERGVKVSTVRAVKFQAQTFLRTNGRSGLVVRGAAAQGRSRTDTNYVRGTNYLLRQRVLVCSHCM